MEDTNWFQNTHLQTIWFLQLKNLRDQSVGRSRNCGAADTGRLLPLHTVILSPVLFTFTTQDPGRLPTTTSPPEPPGKYRQVNQSRLRTQPREVNGL